MKRLLITGAAGGLGRMLRERLTHLAPILRLADIVPIDGPRPHEEIIQCDLSDEAAVRDMVSGCDGILHLGGVSVEQSITPILHANILGMYNLYEAARAHGHPRILFASSNHTVGFWRQTDHLGPDCTFRPDGLYGVSKIFGESLARMYFDKFGQETALLRIGSCTERPENHRMLGSWFSHDDFVRLIEAVFRAPQLGCPVIWGVSNNRRRWWHNGPLDHLDWHPQDDAEDHLAQIAKHMPEPAPNDPTLIYQGGQFTQYPIYKD